MDDKLRSSKAYADYKAQALEQLQRDGVDIFLQAKAQEVGISVNESLSRRTYGANTQP